MSLSNPNNLDVLVLCGGRGERLRPITKKIPKPMVEIKGKPILYYILNYLQSYGLKNFYIGTGYKHEIVKKYLEDYQNDKSIKIINSGDVDIIHRIKETGKSIKGDLLVLYGDTISDVNLNELIKFHKKKNSLATMTVWPMRSQFGLVDFDRNGKVLSFLEKPILDKFMNIGYFYFNNKILNVMKKYLKWEIFLNDMVKMKILKAYVHNGLHITVNTIEELSLAEKDIENINFKKQV
jgi:glucose-1-phosphate cytidylyltransferase